MEHFIFRPRRLISDSESDIESDETDEYSNNAALPATVASHVRPRTSNSQQSGTGSNNPAVSAPFVKRATAASRVGPRPSTSSDSSTRPTTPTTTALPSLELPINTSSSLRNLRQLAGNILMKFQMYILKLT